MAHPEIMSFVILLRFNELNFVQSRNRAMSLHVSATEIISPTQVFESVPDEAYADTVSPHPYQTNDQDERLLRSSQRLPRCNFFGITDVLILTRLPSRKNRPTISLLPAEMRKTKAGTWM